jgi:hypothetical protein
MKTIAALLIAAILLQADSIVHPFDLWGKYKDTEKLDLYVGWANGFFDRRGTDAQPFFACLSSKISYRQALAMIDKYFNDHPERWGIPLSHGILEALTASGSPCYELRDLVLP